MASGLRTYADSINKERVGGGGIVSRCISTSTTTTTTTSTTTTLPYIERRRPENDWTLADLSSWRKTMVLKHLYALYLEHKVERGWERMGKGIKWFLIFLGFAMMMNFGKILQLIATVLTK